jgi:hypothetical protein
MKGLAFVAAALVLLFGGLEILDAAQPPLLIEAVPAGVSLCPRVGPNPCASINCRRIDTRRIA